MLPEINDTNTVNAPMNNAIEYLLYIFNIENNRIINPCTKDKTKLIFLNFFRSIMLNVLFLFLRGDNSNIKNTLTKGMMIIGY